MSGHHCRDLEGGSIVRIAICDDKMILHNDLKRCLDEYAEQHGLVNIYDDFTDGKALIACPKSFELIFMDYQMEGMDGIETSRALRSKKIDTPIIFLSSFPDVVFDTFEVGAYRFLTKPIDMKKLTSAMDALLKSQSDDRSIVIKIDDESRRIDVSDIFYAEASDKYCYIRTADEELLYKATLSELEKLLPKEDFFRSHRSFIVGMKHVKSHTADEVIFTNGERAQISKLNRTPFKKAFLEYVKRHNFKGE